MEIGPDLVTIGIGVDSRPVVKATQDMDAMTAAGERMERGVQGTGTTYSRFAKALADDMQKLMRQVDAMNTTMGGSAVASLKAADASIAQVQSIDRLVAALQKEERQTRENRRTRDDSTEGDRRAKRQADEFIASLQRQAETLGMNRRQMLEYQAAQLGVSTQAMPFIARLTDADKALAKTGVSAAQTAAAMRQVPAQFSDIVVSLQGGQAPLTVLLQQGSQLKDAFGGAGNATRALGGYVMGLVNPFTVAAAGAAALGFAAYQGAAESQRYGEALILTGNYAGVSAGQMSQMATAIAGIGGSRSGAAQALTEIAATGKVAGNQLLEIGTAATVMEAATGKALKDTIAEFIRLGEEPSKASAKLNEQLHYLTASTYAQIVALEKQGEKDAAAALAQGAYTQAVKDRAAQVRENLGWLETAWNSVGNAAKAAWDRMKDLGRVTAAVDEMAKLQEQINVAQNQQKFNSPGSYPWMEDQKGIDKMRARLELLQQSAREEARMAAATEGRAKAEQAGIAAIDGITASTARYADKSQRLTDELGKQKRYYDDLRAAKAIAGDGRQIAELDKLLAGEQAHYTAIRKSYEEKQKVAKTPLVPDSDLANLRARIAEEQRLSDQLKVTGLQADKMTEGEREAAKIAQQILGVTNAKAKAHLQEKQSLYEKLGILERNNRTERERLTVQDKLEDARDKQAASQEAEIQKLLEKADAAEYELTANGRSRESLEELTIARLQERAAILATFDSSAEEVDRLNREIEARQRLSKALDEKKNADRIAQEQKVAVDRSAAEWTRFYDQIYEGLSNSIFRAFESGKSFGKTFIDALKNFFKTTVLRLGINGVLNLSGVAGVLGPGSTAGGGSGLMGAANNASSLYSAYGIANQAMTGGLVGASTASLGYANAVGAVGGDALGALIGANGGWAGVSTGAAASGSVATGASTLGSLGSTLMAAAPYLAAAALVGNALGLFKSKKVTDTGISGTVGFQASDLDAYTEIRKGGSLFSGPKYSTQTRDLDAGQARTLQTAADAIYGSAVTYGKALGLGTSAALGYTKALDISTKDLTDAQIQERLATFYSHLSDDLATAMYFNISRDFGKEGETAAATLARLATSLQGVNGMLDGLDHALLTTSIQGGAAASKLLDAFGGLEAMQQRVGSYQANYYTEAERAAITTRQLSEAVGQLGLSLPATREEFRALVEAQDLYSDSGRATYAALLGLSDAFASITPEIGAVAETVSEAVDSMVLSASAFADKQDQLWGQLFEAMGDTGTLRWRELSALDAQDPSGALRSLQERIYAVGDAAALAAARMTAVDTAYGGVDRAVAKERAAVQSQIDGITASVSKLSNISSRLKSTLDGMSLAGTESQSRAAAQSQIATALAIARAGGAGTIDIEALAPALSRVAQSSEALFADYVSYARDYARTAADLQALADLTAGEQTLAEQQLSAAQAQAAKLDDLLKVTKDWVDLAKGQSVTTLSVLDAVRAMGQAIGAASGNWDYPGEWMLPQSYTAPQTQVAAGNGNAELLAKIDALTREVAAMRTQSAQQLEKVVDSTQKTERTLSDAARGNQPLMTTATA